MLVEVEEQHQEGLLPLKLPEVGEKEEMQQPPLHGRTEAMRKGTSPSAMRPFSTTTPWSGTC